MSAREAHGSVPGDVRIAERDTTLMEPLFSRIAAWTSSAQLQPAVLSAALSSWCVSFALLITSSKTWLVQALKTCYVGQT